MAGPGRKKRKIKFLAEALKDGQILDEDAREAVELWSGLPTELLELIISQLTLKDNICISAVCKKWQSVAVSVRVVQKSPWIMHFPKHGDLFEFYDPCHRKSYLVELPELRSCRVCYAKDNWLLLYKPITQRLLFFNPFTRKLIKLPKYELSYQIVAFSSAPTSPNCLVFTVRHVSPTVVSISTCHPRAAHWSTVNYRNRLPFVSSIWNKLVFSNGLFYCLSLTGWLGIYDTQEHTWTVCGVPPPKCPENFYSKNWWKGKFMTEYKGDILVIYTCENENPIVYKLERTNWTEMNTLGGVTLFASFLTSHARTDLLGVMRNSVYFTKVRFYGKRCISYSLDQGRYYPKKQCHDWGEQDPFESIWIEPPEDFTDFVKT